MLGLQEEEEEEEAPVSSRLSPCGSQLGWRPLRERGNI